MRIAHLSDVHMLDRDAERAPSRYRAAARIVGVGRAFDPRLRARRLARALAFAKEARVDHVVISGDLTELGDAREFEHFADVLHASGLAPESVTLVPGNHDAYTPDGGFARAIAGPLRAFAASSAGALGKVVDRGAVAFLPIDTSCLQSIALAGGVFTADAAAALEARLGDPGLARKALVLVAHHPPVSLLARAARAWFDGLTGAKRLEALLYRHPRTVLLHGHLHRAWSRARMFGAAATVEDPETGGPAAQTKPAVRLYEGSGGIVLPLAS